jgi:hypothetical protein
MLKYNWEKCIIDYINNCDTHFQSMHNEAKILLEFGYILNFSNLSMAVLRNWLEIASR